MYIILQDDEDLFNFIPTERRVQDGNSSPKLFRKRKRNDEEQLFSFVKKPSRGFKVIKIEVYDADKFRKLDKGLCDCDAEICVQYVAKSSMGDDIYKCTKDLIDQINENIQTSTY